MIANHPISGHNYSYHIRGDRSPLIKVLLDCLSREMCSEGPGLMIAIHSLGYFI